MLASDTTDDKLYCAMATPALVDEMCRVALVLLALFHRVPDRSRVCATTNDIQACPKIRFPKQSNDQALKNRWHG
jgi:hypothetical protein